MGVLGGVLMVAGASFSLLAAVGVVRFHDTYARMHAAAKASTLGLLLVVAGAALSLRTTSAVVMLGLVVVLQLLTTPVAAHLLGSGIHRHDGAVSVHDELADADVDVAASGHACGEDPVG